VTSLVQSYDGDDGVALAQMAWPDAMDIYIIP
jgi:hypothetical protein